MEDPQDTWNRELYSFRFAMEKTIGDSSYKGLPEKVTEKQLGHTSEVFEFLDRAQKWQETYHPYLENYSILYH